MHSTGTTIEPQARHVLGQDRLHVDGLSPRLLDDWRPLAPGDEEIVAPNRHLARVFLCLDHEDPTGADRDVIDVRLRPRDVAVVQHDVAVELVEDPLASVYRTDWSGTSASSSVMPVRDVSVNTAGMTVLSFDEALDSARDFGPTANVLLGNGFSIACRSNTFRYAALLDSADFTGLSVDPKSIFDEFDTYDFERIVEVLESSAQVLQLYGEQAGEELIARFRKDADIVRNALATAIAARHPERPSDISDNEYEAVQRFLANFERVYSLNYDLLLYWAIMHDPPEDLAVPRNDGFFEPDEADADYVAWEGYEYSLQRIFYLHGALHLFDFGTEIRKFTWSRTGIRLVDQIRDALSSRRYPLVVTEGSSRKKEEKIRHNIYLVRAIRSFASLKVPLFMHGVSMSSNDDHVYERLVESNVRAVFVSIYGDPTSSENRQIVGRVQQIADSRPPRRARLNVFLYDAESAHAWG